MSPEMKMSPKSRTTALAVLWGHLIAYTNALMQLSSLDIFWTCCFGWMAQVLKRHHLSLHSSHDLHNGYLYNIYIYIYIERVYMLTSFIYNALCCSCVLYDIYRLTKFDKGA